MADLVSYHLWADIVLVIHFFIVIFVVGGLPLIVIGNWLGWKWVNYLWFRLVHLSVIIIVVLQAWLGRFCSLTVLESWLREQAGQPAYTQSFIEYWLQRALYYQAPFWVFVAAYTLFALLVVWVWWRYPPIARR